MTYLFPILFLLTNACKGATILEVPEQYLTSQVKIIANWKLYPDNLQRITRDNKPRLGHGTPSLAQSGHMTYVESIPVETRIRAILKLTKVGRRHLIPRHVNTQYEKYLVSLMFIDVRVLEALVTLASQKSIDNTRVIQSATDIIENIQKSFPRENFYYLTPDYILQWYEIIGTIELRLFILPDDEKRIMSQHFVKSTGPVLLQLAFEPWKRLFLRPRLERLATTGYEFSKIN